MYVYTESIAGIHICILSRYNEDNFFLFFIRKDIKNMRDLTKIFILINSSTFIKLSESLLAARQIIHLRLLYEMIMHAFRPQFFRPQIYNITL